MASGRVVHVRKDRYTRYIGRGRGPRGDWGNPFQIGEPHPVTRRPMTREDVVRLHMEYVVRGEGRRLLSRLGEREGETLGCFCAPEGGLTEHDQPFVCHGQNLLKLLSWRRRRIEEKRAALASGAPTYRVVRESQISFRTGHVEGAIVASGLAFEEARRFAGTSRPDGG